MNYIFVVYILFTSVQQLDSFSVKKKKIFHIKYGKLDGAGSLITDPPLPT